MAIALEAAWGLGERLSWLGDPETIAPRLRLDPPLAARVEDHLRRAEDRALRILQAQRPVLEAIAAALRDKSMLTGPTLEELISRVRPETAQPTRGEGALEIPEEMDQSGPGDERAAKPDTDWSAPYQPLDRAA
jgi:hypothetical protein